MPYIFSAVRIILTPIMILLGGKPHLIKQPCDLSTPASSAITGTYPIVI